MRTAMEARTPSFRVPVLLLCLAALAGCAPEQYKDIIRLRPERAQRYEQEASYLAKDKTLTLSIDNVSIYPKDQYCSMDTVVIAEDANGKELRIPIGDVQLIASLTNLDPGISSHQGLDLFERHYEVRENPDIIKVPVSEVTCSGSVDKPPCPNPPCPEPPPPPCIECIQRSLFGDDWGLEDFLLVYCRTRSYPWWFAELRGVLAVYNDYGPDGERGMKSGVLHPEAELVGGVRFGAARNWGIGVGIDYPVGYHDRFSGEELIGPVSFLHLRYSPADKFLGVFCFKPFVYVQGGALLINRIWCLTKYNLSENSDYYCATRDIIERSSGFSLSLPITWGFGAGFDLPISDSYDLSFDAGYRSLAVVDMASWDIYNNILALRRIGQFRFRLGITF